MKSNTQSIGIQSNQIPQQPQKTQNLFNHILASSQINLSKTLIQDITNLKNYAQNKNYIWFTANQKNDYLQYLYNGYPRLHQHTHNLQQLFNQKNKVIQKQIEDNNLHLFNRIKNKYDIEKKLDEKKLNKMKQQTINLKQKLYKVQKSIQQQLVKKPIQQQQQQQQEQDEQKIRQIRQLISRIRIQKIKRAQRHLQQVKIQQELNRQRQQQQKRKEQKQRQQRNRRILQKNKQLDEKRSMQKQLRKKYNSQLLRLKKQIKQKPRLHQKMQQNYYYKLKKQQTQIRQKLLSQRRSQPIDIKKIQQHNKKYSQLLNKQKQKRKIRQLMSKQQQLFHTKFYSSYKQQQKNQPSEDQIKQKLKQKLHRIKNYQHIVKTKHKPKIDQNKQKQLMFLLQSQQNKKKLKKSVLENGSVLYQQLPQNDTRKLGIAYLQYVKKLTQKYKQNHNSKQQQQFIQTDSNTKPMTSRQQQMIKKQQKQTDYLQQLRLIKKRKLDRSMQVDKRSYSYNDKLQKLQLQFELLDEQMLRKQKLLKYGRFETPQQIFRYKQQLDEYYIDAINTKLKLINQNK